MVRHDKLGLNECFNTLFAELALLFQLFFCQRRLLARKLLNYRLFKLAVNGVAVLFAQSHSKSITRVLVLNEFELVSYLVEISWVAIFLFSTEEALLSQLLGKG